MSAGRFVGRVGGLAVALGVGVAVASSPAVAWADDAGAASSEGSTGSAGAAGTTGTPDSAGTSAAIGTTDPPAGTSSGTGTETEGASTPGSGSVNTAESGLSASTGASVREVPPGTAMSTGGADSSTKSNSETADVDAKLTTDRSALAKPVEKSTVGGPSRSPKRRQRVVNTSGAQAAETNTLTLTDDAAPRPETSSTRTVQELSERRAAQEHVTAILPTHANFVAQAVSAARTDSPSTVSAVVLAALATAGLGPLAPNGPLTPVDSPLGLALLAVGARARPLSESAIEETRSLSVSSPLTGESVDAEQIFAVATLMTAVNSAPNVPQQPIGTTDPVTGVVTGAVIATDPDNNILTYTVASGPSNGTVQLNAQTGAYTYTPTQAARVTAGGTASVDTDAFTVAVSDGQQTSTVAVSVYISPIRFESKAPIAVGSSPSGVVVGPDGRMYVANTGSGTVSVINTVTGQLIDANSSAYSKSISVGSSPSALALSADGKRLYVANTGSGTVSVIDTTTYKRIDVNPSYWSKDIKVGSSPSALTLGPDGRLYVANRASNTVSVIDTATNKLVDINPNVSGTQSLSVGTSPSALILGGDGRLYVANRGSNTVSVINTTSYSVTNTITVGSQPSGMALGTNGRLYVVNTGNGTVSVIDTVTSTVIDTNPNAAGTNAISVGPSPTSVAFSQNGSFAYVANANDTVSVIDTATYTVLRTVVIDSDTTGGHVIAVSPSGSIYVTDAADKTVRVLTIGYGNAAPVAGIPTVGTPNSVNGAVTGALNFTDADGNTLSYSLTQPSTGTVSITSAGVYTFTPTLAARKAAATGGPTSTSFTVNATDGQATTSVNVTVPIAAPVAATGVAVVGSRVTLTGYLAGQVFTPDGARVVTTTDATDWDAGIIATRVAVVNASTGAQIGTTLTFAGFPQGAPLLNADGTRAVIITHQWVTQVVVLDTTTGKQIGTTFTLAGENAGATLLSSDGARVLVTTTSSDLVTGGTRVAVIDTATGTQTGTTLKLPVYQSVTWDADDAHALVTTTDGDWTTGFTTQVAVIDLTTGTQTGTPFTLAGRLTASPLLSNSGNHAVLTTDDAGVTRAAVINAATGAQIGTTVTVAGSTSSVALIANATRALITTRVEDAATHIASTMIVTIDTTTGTQIGTTVSLAGTPWSTQVNAEAGYTLITAGVTGNDIYTIVSTQVAVINTTTGAQTGTTLTLTGRQQGAPLLSAEGSRALISFTDGSAVIINTTTGEQVGGTLTLTGQPKDFQLVNADHTVALIATTVPSSSLGSGTTQVALFNTATGGQIGTSLTVAGDTGALQLSFDGTHALIITSVYNPYAWLSDPYSTRVAVIDTTTGKQTGTTLTLSGAIYGSHLLSADGTHALITTATWNPVSYSGTTRMAVINTTTGKQVGSTLTLSDSPSVPPLFSADGTHAVVTTEAPDGSETITRLAILRIF